MSLSAFRLPVNLSALAPLLLVAACSQAGEAPESASKADQPRPAAAAGDLSQVRETIAATLQSAKADFVVTKVEAAPIAGLYQVTIGGGPQIYSTADGKFFVVGDVYEVAHKEIVNLTERGRDGQRAEAMASVEKKDMIIFPAEGKMKKAMYVFTDVDCGYCQLLHSKVAEYNKMGIEVRYLAYPRAGVGSGSYRKIASAWCAENPQDALTKLKQREEIPENVCDTNPVAKQFELGRSIGLTGTPALIMEDGQLIAGYVEPARLKEMLKL